MRLKEKRIELRDMLTDIKDIATSYLNSISRLEGEDFQECYDRLYSEIARIEDLVD